MRLRILIALAILCTPISLEAQDLIVRSGEHEGFTRLVVPISRDGEWKIDQENRVVKLTVPSLAGSFDTSRIFQFIQRTRVLNVANSSGGLTINLACDCQVAPFSFRDRFIVIDIASQETDLVAPAISSRLEKTQEKVPQRLAEINTQGRAPLSKVTNRREPAQPSASNFGTLEQIDFPTHFRNSLSKKGQTALAEMQDRLLRELSTAATRGVLTPRPDEQFSSGLQDTLPPKVPIPQPQTEPNRIAARTKNNLRITSSNDFTDPAQHPRGSISTIGLSCPSNIVVDLANWADERPFHEQTAIARQNLYGEFDRLQKTWAKKLAKTYIHFGFGAEALQVLSFDPGLREAEPVLYDIAHILENGSASEFSDLGGFIDCNTDISLWAILSKEKLEEGSLVEPNAALRALNRLPVHLRKFLAPELSQRFLSHGDQSAAAAAMRSIDRLPSPLPTAGKMAKARIAIDEGNLMEGAEALLDVVNDNSKYSPQALISLVQTKLAANQPIDSGTASLIEAYANELRGSDIGSELLGAHVLALVRSGQFDRAFTAMEELGGTSDQDSMSSLRLDVLQEVTVAAEDVVFLEYAFAQSSEYLASIPDQHKTRLAARLLGLGFPSRAKAVIFDIPKPARTLEQQILFGRIALALEQPQRALSELAEAAGLEADILRAEALLMAGMYANAAIAFRESELSEAAIAAAWLGEGLNQESFAEDPVFGPVLKLTELNADVLKEANGMLRRSNSALEESEEARKTLEDFLEDPRISIEDMDSDT